ncbi:MAG: ISL3 family transposase [Candidatus Auribacterota bacterium]|nr:ISL3 family transposase [Candidatus Auribacterota bacterium]
MSSNKLIRKLLKLKSIRVSGFFFAKWNTELHLIVKPYKNGCRCPECHRRCKIVRVMSERRKWRDIRVCGIMVYWHYAPKEVLCPTHGRIQEAISWAEYHGQITYRLEFLLLIYSQRMTQKAAAELLNLAKSTFSDLLHRSIKRIREGHRIRGLKKIGVDEISYRRGKKYATLVYDLERGVVVWVGKGKGSETINQFFTTFLSCYQRKKIKWASCDMSRAYINAIKKHCPNAKLVLDHFHITKALNNALDEVRKEEWRKLKQHDKKQGRTIKGLRWLLFRHANNRTKSDTRVLNQLKTSNRHIYRAWILKDEFAQFWCFSYAGAARTFAKKWMTAAAKSRLEPYRKFAVMLREHFEDIITYIGSRLTNAVGEGLNRIVRIVKNRASGFFGLEAFQDMIFLTVGDLDIPAQIPKKFDTAGVAPKPRRFA